MTTDKEGTGSQEEWVPMGDAAKVLKVSHAKLSRMGSQGRFKTKKDIRDERVTLVDLAELRRLFNIK